MFGALPMLSARVRRSSAQLLDVDIDARQTPPPQGLPALQAARLLKRFFPSAPEP